MNFGKFSIKNVQTFRSSEGYGLNANLYLGKKQVASFMDAGNGGEADIEFITKHANADEIKASREANAKAIIAEMVNIGWRKQIADHKFWGTYHPLGAVDTFVYNGVRNTDDGSMDLGEATKILVECLAEAKEDEKSMKQGVCFTDNQGIEKIMSIGNMQLPSAVKKYGEAKIRQSVFNAIVRIKQNGGTVTNMDYLKSANLYA